MAFLLVIVSLSSELETATVESNGDFTSVNHPQICKELEEKRYCIPNGRNLLF
jgi:hypothetical protein